MARRVIRFSSIVMAGRVSYSRIMEAKAAVRIRGRQLRGELTADARAALDSQILARCQSDIAWAKCRLAMVFLPIERLNEIDTWPLVLWLWEKRRRTRLYVPQIIGGRIQAVQITPRSTFSTSKWGIPEPADGAVLLEREELDLVIIPMLGFDSRGHRVGYGHGYFDKFLASHRRARRIGIGYEALYAPDGILEEKHDIALDAVITEQRIHRFKSRL